MINYPPVKHEPGYTAGIEGLKGGFILFYPRKMSRKLLFPIYQLSVAWTANLAKMTFSIPFIGGQRLDLNHRDFLK